MQNDKIKQIQSWYDGWKASGLNQKTYCKEQGISFHILKRGLYQLRKKGLLNQSENLIRYMFIKVKDHQELPTKLANEKK